MQVIGQSRRFLARKRDGSLVPIKLAVLEQRLGDARVFVGTLEPVDPATPGSSSSTSPESSAQISPREDGYAARLASAPRSSAGSSEGRERLSPGASCSPLSDGSDIEALSLSTFGQISPDLVYAFYRLCFGSGGVGWPICHTFLRRRTVSRRSLAEVRTQGSSRLSTKAAGWR